MKQQLAVSSLPTGAFIASGQAHAQTAEIKGIGRIQPGGACRMALSGIGIVDLGAITHVDWARNASAVFPMFSKKVFLCA